MLEVTSSAASTLASVRDAQGLPDHFGFRIAASSGDPAANSHATSPYQLGFAPEPQEDDVVTETDGTRVFVAQEVAPSLDRAVLDVADGTGNLILTRRA